MENNSENAQNGVSKRQRKRGIRAVLAEVQATGEPAEKRQSMVTANLSIRNISPGIKQPRGNPQKAVKIREENKIKMKMIQTSKDSTRY